MGGRWDTHQSIKAATTAMKEWEKGNTGNPCPKCCMQHAIPQKPLWKQLEGREGRKTMEGTSSVPSVAWRCSIEVGNSQLRMTWCPSLARSTPVAHSYCRTHSTSKAGQKRLLQFSCDPTIGSQAHWSIRDDQCASESQLNVQRKAEWNANK